MDSQAFTPDTEFLRLVSSLLKVLMRKATESAMFFVRACGRNVVLPKDIKIALMYEAHVFFERDDFERQVRGALAAESLHSYETDEDENEDENDEDSDEHDREEGEENTESGTVYEEIREEEVESEMEVEHTMTFSAREEYRQQHEQMCSYYQGWSNWNPTDEAQILLKRAIDAMPA